MTATAAEPDVETSTGDGDDLEHIGCHCGQDENGGTAWCGIQDDSPLSEDVIEESPNPCPLCMLVLESCSTKGQCPWGCRCVKWCGPNAKNEEEDKHSEMRGHSSRHSVIDEWTGF